MPWAPPLLEFAAATCVDAAAREKCQNHAADAMTTLLVRYPPAHANDNRLGLAEVFQLITDVPEALQCVGQVGEYSALVCTKCLQSSAPEAPKSILVRARVWALCAARVAGFVLGSQCPRISITYSFNTRRVVCVWEMCTGDIPHDGQHSHVGWAQRLLTGYRC